MFLYEFMECELLPTCSHWLVVAVHLLRQATAKRSSEHATDQQRALF